MITQFIGRLHPLIVHLPIGILLLAFGLECWARWQKRFEFQPFIRLSLACGAFSAAAAAACGWLLAREGGYAGDLLATHERLGFATAGLALLVWWGQARRWYFPALTLTLAALTAAGHFGGSLTHGEGYLFQSPEPQTAISRPPLTPETPVFAGMVQPVLKEKCLSCHNAGKRKGDLNLENAEALQRGGKNGAAFIAGKPAESLLLKRLQLPLHDDDHMPPAGKPQPTPAELRLLEWWIAQGADFQLTASALPEDIAAEWNKSSLPANPVFAQNVKGATPEALEKLKNLRVSVSQLSPETPWLNVSLAGQDHISDDCRKALRAVGRQTVHLDLANTDLDDAGLLADFPNLVRLNLANTRMTDNLLNLAGQWPGLESLNLTGTRVTDAVLEPLAGLQQLRHLYLWQTRVSAQGIESLRQRMPALHIETGAVLTDTSRLALRSPKMLYGRNFFDDTMMVALHFPFRGVSIYYTLDEAASPTTQSLRYQGPIVLDKTAHLRAFAAKEGWSPSPVVDAVFVKKQFAPAGATLARPPSPKYPAKGALSLNDGKIAAEQGADTWLGYEGESLMATLDLGALKPLRQVFVHCLENNVAWIFKPAAIRVYTSAEGKQFRPAGEQRYPQNKEMGEPKTHLLSVPLQTEPARYVRVQVESLLKNPVWHPSKGQKCWIFVDEIVVE